MITLALQNITERKSRVILASLSIAIGTASLIVFLGLSNGIEQATFSELEKKSPLTQITVSPNTKETGIISLLSKTTDGKLNKETIEQISKINGVKNIYPEIQFNNFASLEVPIFGMTLATETMIFGVPAEFIENDISSREIWNKNEEPYPAIIPRKLLDLYNLAVASPQNLPLLSENNLIGKELTLFPNYSTFFPFTGDKTESVKLEVVGFSDKVNLIGATLPYQVVEKLNQENARNLNQNYLELFVETSDPTLTTEVAKKIEKLGYSTAYFQKNLQDVEAKFTYLKTSLGIISLIILLTAAIAIISTFLAGVAERSKEIGLFRAIGATKNHIKKLILIEAGIIGIIGSIIGTAIGLTSSVIIDRIGLEQLKQTTFTPETLFHITPNLILFTIIFGTTVSILAGYLPARKAANINPIEALNRL